MDNRTLWWFVWINSFFFCKPIHCIQYLVFQIFQIRKKRKLKHQNSPKNEKILTQKNSIEGVCDWWSVLSFPKLEWLGTEGVTWCYNYYFFKTTLWFWNHTKTQIQKQKVEVQKLQIQIHCVSGGQRRTLVGRSRGRRQRRLFASPDLHSLFCLLLSSQLLYFRAQIRKYIQSCN